MDEVKYKEYVKENAPRTSEFKTLLIAFCVGGVICMVGQAFGDLYAFLLPEWPKEDIGSLVSITMIFLGAFLTGIGVYDKMGYHAGGGTIVPITGFANSIVSPAMEFNKEGIVLGVMAKMFVIAGPIIVSGISVSVLVGTIYWIIGLF